MLQVFIYKNLKKIILKYKRWILWKNNRLKVKLLNGKMNESRSRYRKKMQGIISWQTEL